MSKPKYKKIVVAIYIDPDFYPPTINAILNMAETCEELVVVSRNNNAVDFPFPANVRLKKIGKLMSVRDSERTGTWQKITSFLSFTLTLLSSVRKGRTELLVLYDPFPLLAWYITRFFMPSTTTVWYHNHDMPSKGLLRKYSIGWFAARYESVAMKKIHFFSLPSADRLVYYPDLSKDLPYATIPNYPSLRVYKSPESKSRHKEIRIIYQGFVGPGHSLEDIIRLLPEHISGKRLQLILKGSVTPDYKDKLQSLADSLGVTERLIWVGIGPYVDLPGLTKSCDIGIGIHMNTDHVSKTLGTASNKIYEYAACGLPVILYHSEQFTKYLSKYRWTFFSDGSADTIRQAIGQIIPYLDDLGHQARMDFEHELNFDSLFQQAAEKVCQIHHERRS